MSAWSRPYLKVHDATGRAVTWELPRPLPLPAGASAHPDTPGHTTTAAALGLPPGGRLAVRWRAPGAANPRKATFEAERMVAGVALACDVQRAADAAGHGWEPDPLYRPRPAPQASGRGAPPSAAGTAQAPQDHPAPAAAASRPATGDGTTALPPGTPPPTAAPGAVVLPAAPAAALAAGGGAAGVLMTAEVLDPASRVRVSPDNLLLRGVAEGRLALGATITDLIAMVLRERWDSWGPAHRTNMSSVLELIAHHMVYREPWEDDPAEIAAWKRARLSLPGVDVEGSQHVALLLPPDLADAVMLRRTTDRRIERLNVQALARHEDAWARYLTAQRAKAAGTWRGGRLPNRPPDTVQLRSQPETVGARTEELFATGLGALLGTAERAGLLLGPNPWGAFAPKGRPQLGYRRPRPLAIHERNVLPMGAVVDLADAISTMGPVDRRTGLPAGERFRALVLASAAAGRPSEYAGLRPDEYRPGPRPELWFLRSAGPAAPQANEGVGYHVADRTKGRQPGTYRAVGLPRYVADAIEAHIGAGYASDAHLFTGPGGGPLRWGNLTDTYWRPAVAKVCGHSREPLLRDLELRWLRKGAISWLLRAGKPITEVADLAGHTPGVLLGHYAGIVHSQGSTRLWTGWDQAWEWASAETAVP